MSHILSLSLSSNSLHLALSHLPYNSGHPKPHTPGMDPLDCLYVCVRTHVYIPQSVRMHASCWRRMKMRKFRCETFLYHRSFRFDPATGNGITSNPPPTTPFTGIQHINAQQTLFVPQTYMFGNPHPLSAHRFAHETGAPKQPCCKLCPVNAFQLVTIRNPNRAHQLTRSHRNELIHSANMFQHTAHTPKSIHAVVNYWNNNYANDIMCMSANTAAANLNIPYNSHDEVDSIQQLAGIDARMGCKA